MDNLQRVAIEQACAKLMNQFAVFNDHGRFADLDRKSTRLNSSH